MSSVDNRVVELEFDNDQFEKGVSTTLNTLDKLKESLSQKFDSSIFSGLNKSIDDIPMDHLVAGADAVSNRFSSMGIVGATVLSELTKTIMSTGSSLVTNLINPIVSGGWNRASNIEQAKFQIEGLGKDWQALSQDITQAVDGTAYGFDEAAMAAGQLSASGIQAGDTMEHALQGISGTAAMTGRSYTDISRIFTTVAGNGRLMSEQLLQFSSSGINAAATLATYLGKDEATVRDMVSKGEIDFQTFSDAMYSAFGEHAKDANKTFTGAMSNVHAAMSKIGADFESVLISSDDQQKGINNLIGVLNGFRNVLNAVRTALKTTVVVDFANTVHTVCDSVVNTLNSMFEVVNQNGSSVTQFVEPLRNAFDNFYQSFKNVSNFILNVASSIGQAWNTIFPPVTFDTIEKISEGIKNLTSMLPTAAIAVVTDNISDLNSSLENTDKTVSSSQRFFNNLKETFSGVFAVVDILRKAVSGIVKLVQTFVFPVIGKVIEIAAAITGTIGSWVTAIDKAVPSTDSFNDAVDGLATFLKPLADILSTVVDFIVDFIDSIRPGADFLGNLATWAGKAADAFSGLLGSIQVPGGGTLYDVMVSIFGPVGDFLESTYTFVSTGLNNIFGAISGFVSDACGVENPLGTAFDAIRNVFDGFLSYLDGIKMPDGVSVLSKIEDTFDKLGKFFSEIIKSLKTKFDTLVKYGSQFIETFTKSFNINGNPFEAFTDAIKNLMSAIETYLKGIKLPDGSSLYDGLVSMFSPAINFIKTIQPSLETASKGITDTVGGWITGLLDAFSKFNVTDNPLANIYLFFKDIFDKLGKLFSTDPFEPTKAYAKTISDSSDKIEKASKPFDNISNSLSGISDFMDNFFNNIIPGIADAASKGFGGILKGIGDFISGLSTNTDYLKYLLDYALKVALTIASIKLMLSVSEMVESFSNIANGIAGPLGELSKTIKTYRKSLAVKAILDVCKGIAILAAVLIVLGNVPWDVLGKGAAVLAGLAAGILIFAKVINSCGNFEGIGKGILSFAGGLAILTVSMLILSRMDWESIARGGAALALMAVGVGVAIGIMTKLNTNKVSSIAKGILGFAAAMLILTVAVKKLGNMDYNTLEQGISAIFSLTLIMGTCVAVLEEVSKGCSSVVGPLLAFAAAIVILTVAVGILGDMNSDKLSQGLDALGTLVIYMIGTMVAMAVVTELSKSVIIAVAVIAAAFAVMAYAAYELAQCDPDTMNSNITTIVEGLVCLLLLSAVIVLLPELAAGLVVLGDACLAIGASIFLAGVGLTLFFNALTSVDTEQAQQMVDVMNTLAGIDWAKLAGAAISLVAFGIASLVAGAGMIVLGAGMAIMQNIDADQIASVCESITNGFANLDPGNLALVGAALIVVGVGALLAGAGLLVLNAAGAGLDVVVAALQQICLLDPGTLALIGVALLAIGVGGIVAGAGAIVLGAGLTVAAIGLSVLATAIYGIMSMFGLLDTTMANTGNNASVNFPAQIASGASAATSSTQGLSDGISGALSGLPGLFSSTGDSSTTNLIDALNNGAGGASGAGSLLSGSADGGLSGLSGLLSGDGSDGVNSFIGALSDTGGANDAGNSIGSAANSGVQDGGGDWDILGNNFGQGLCNGISGMVSSVADAARNLGATACNALHIRLDENSPSKLTYKYGAFFDQGLINGMDALVSDVAKSSTGVGTAAVTSLDTSMSLVQDALEDSNYNPSITPVIDMSEIQNGMSSINSLMNNSSFGIGTTLQTSGLSTVTPISKGIISSSSNTGLGVTNNGDSYTFSFDGITYNDREDMQDVTREYIKKMTRLAAM